MCSWSINEYNQKITISHLIHSKKRKRKMITMLNRKNAIPLPVCIRVSAPGKSKQNNTMRIFTGRKPSFSDAQC